MKEKIYMDTARLWAENSKCARLHVGACLVNKDGRVVGCSYNGTVSGAVNCSDVFLSNPQEDDYKIDVRQLSPYAAQQVVGPSVDPDLAKDPLPCSYEDWRAAHHRFSELFEVHAEANCVANVAKSGCVTPLSECTMYVSHSPCNSCLKLLAANGVKKVVYNKEYDGCNIKESIALAKDLGIELTKYGE